MPPVSQSNKLVITSQSAIDISDLPPSCRNCPAFSLTKLFKWGLCNTNTVDP